MTTDVFRESAQIIPFPVGGRTTVATARAEGMSAVDIRSQHVAAEALGGAWYHEAAIQDSKRAGER